MAWGQVHCTNCEKDVVKHTYIRKEIDKPASHYDGCSHCGLPISGVNKVKRRFHGLSSLEITVMAKETGSGSIAAVPDAFLKDVLKVINDFVGLETATASVTDDKGQIVVAPREKVPFTSSFARQLAADEYSSLGEAICDKLDNDYYVHSHGPNGCTLKLA